MHRWLPALLIIALLAGFRILSSAFPDKIPNVQPLLAVLLCSLVFLKGIQRWLIPLLVWIITDPVTSLMQGYPVFGWHHLSLILGVFATFGIAQIVRRHPTAVPVLLAAAGSAIAFHLLTNLLSFMVDPRYAKTWQGFLQAEWTGPAGLGPTWVFLRNGLAANLAFTGLFLIARCSLPLLSEKSAPAAVR